MKYQLLLILLICTVLSDCTGVKKHSTGTLSNKTIVTNKEIPIKTLDDTTVTDIDGNTYPIVLIGNRLWMASNLKVSKYNNGTAVLPYSGGGFLKPLEKGMFVIYDNDTTNENKYGKLYNFYAVAEGCLCPEGWRVPTLEDWKELIKSQGEKKLNFLFGGFLNPQDISPFSDIDKVGYWWSSTSVGRNTSAIYKLDSDRPNLKKSGMNESSFLAVRCVKNK